MHSTNLLLVNVQHVQGHILNTVRRLIIEMIVIHLSLNELQIVAIFTCAVHTPANKEVRGHLSVYLYFFFLQLTNCNYLKKNIYIPVFFFQLV